MKTETRIQEEIKVVERKMHSQVSYPMLQKLIIQHRALKWVLGGIQKRDEQTNEKIWVSSKLTNEEKIIKVLQEHPEGLTKKQMALFGKIALNSLTSGGSTAIGRMMKQGFLKSEVVPRTQGNRRIYFLDGKWKAG